MIEAPVPIRRAYKRAIPVSETIEGWIFVAATALTVYLVKTGVMAKMLAHNEAFDIASAFISGFFFTSMLTAIPAAYAIAESAIFMPAWKLALIGGIGSMVGDLVMFRLMRSAFADRLIRAALHPAIRLIGRALSTGRLWWTAPVFGVIAFASPLPDEIGVLMMGLSRAKTSRLIVVAFITHTAGIYIIALLVQSALQ